MKAREFAQAAGLDATAATIDRPDFDLIAVFDKAPTNPRYWLSMGLLSIALALEFFDFYIVGFVVAVISPQWHLTYGQSSIMLLSAGLGGIAGALLWGNLADAFGRKRMIVLGAFTCAVNAGAIALVPDGAWMFFALLRFGVGVGLGGSNAPIVATVVEYTPTRYRSMIPGLTIVFATVGTLLASATSATLLSLLGWRGVSALGIVPAIAGILVLWIVPESVRWLMAKGRFEEARAEAARLLKLPLDRVPLPTARPSNTPSASYGELYAAGPSRFWLTIIAWMGMSTANYGVYLWGPTIVALLLNKPVQEAAFLFVYVALTGIVGKIIFSLLPQWLGRRRCGLLAGFGIAVLLASAGILHDRFYQGVPVFIVLLAAGALFFDGGFSNLGPYTAELFPVGLAARACGLGQAANGLGKILGPLSLALIAGAGNIVAPQATADAVLPAFLFLAGCGLAVGLAFVFVPIETHGKPLTIGFAKGPRDAVIGAPTL
jgi:MFS transporter, putative metabolite:H+ symporter